MILEELSIKPYVVYNYPGKILLDPISLFITNKSMGEMCMELLGLVKSMALSLSVYETLG